MKKRAERLSTRRGPQFSTQGMAGGFARAAPHRLYRGPKEARAAFGSWRALCVCPCGDPYCWCSIFKVPPARLTYHGIFNRELGNQFTNLNNAHTAGILEKVVIFKCGKVMMIPLQIIRNPPTVHNDFPENNLITHFDRATPLLSESFPKSRDRKTPL